MKNKVNNSKKILISLSCVLLFTITSCKGSGKIIGETLLGIFVTYVIDCLFNKESCPIANAKENENENKKREEEKTKKQNTNNNIKSSENINTFYYLADTAFAKVENANNKINKLRYLGYNQSGAFWLQNYPNLSNKPYYQVYIAKFNNRRSCIEFLKNYIQRNQDAYCGFASKNKNVSPDYYGSHSLKNIKY